MNDLLQQLLYIGDSSVITDYWFQRFPEFRCIKQDVMYFGHDGEDYCYVF